MGWIILLSIFHNLEFKDGQSPLNLKYGVEYCFPDKKIGQLIVDNVITSNSEIGSKEFLRNENTK